MAPETRQLNFQKMITARPAQVYYAFTNATALKEWLCNVATIRPKPGGRLYLAWDSGFYTCGEFTEVEQDRKVSFTWQGRGEPGPSRVEILLEQTEQGTQLLLTHHEIGASSEWDRVVQEIEEGWTDSLSNLASVLETGEDQRIVLRPMLGIFPSDFNAHIAAKLGVPVTEGLRLDDVVDGLGAARAGLQKDDVLVSLAGNAMTDYASLSTTMQHQRAGNTIEVVFYRGPEKMSVMMELSRRQIPTIPPTISEFAQAARSHYEKIQQDIDQFFIGVTDEEAAYKPLAEEWSALEALAHLILTERSNQSFVTEILGGQERWADDYADNIAPPINASLAAFPTLADMLSELRRCYAESIGLYANIPGDFPENRKPSYWRLAYYLLQAPAHEYGHFEQMGASIEAARAKH